MIKFSLKNDLFLVSGGEGGILEFWNVQADGEINHKQLLQTPVQSIWTIAFTPDGDINIGAEYILNCFALDFYYFISNNKVHSKVKYRSGKERKYFIKVELMV